MGTSLSTRAAACSALVLAAASLLLAESPQQLVVSDPGPRPEAEILAATEASDWRPLDPENTLYLELASGRIVIELAPDYAPLHVAQMKALARGGFYDGLAIYRAVENFVVQGGDQSGERSTGDAAKTLPAEFERTLEPALPFTPLGAADGYAAEVGFVNGFPAARDRTAGKSWLVHCPRAMAMARDNLPETGGTEFYVVIGHAPRYLDRNLTIFGRVLRGQELLQVLPRGHGERGVIDDPERRTAIISLRVAADLPASERTPLEILRTDSAAFLETIAARRNRPEQFFIYRPDHIDVCGVPIPAREPTAADGAAEADAE